MDPLESSPSPEEEIAKINQATEQLQSAGTIAEKYAAAKLVVDLPDTDDEGEMRKQLSMLKGSWLSSNEAEGVIKAKETLLTAI